MLIRFLPNHPPPTLAHHWPGGFSTALLTIKISIDNLPGAASRPHTSSCLYRAAIGKGSNGITLAETNRSCLGFFCSALGFLCFFGETNYFRARFLYAEGVWPVSFLKILPKPVGSEKPRVMAISVTLRGLVLRRFLAFMTLQLLRYP